MSGITTYGETGPEDYLNQVRKEQAASKAGSTSQDQLGEHGLIPLGSDYIIDDTVTIDANKQGVFSNYQVNDDASVLGLSTGLAAGFRWGRGVPTFRLPTTNGKNRWFAGKRVDGREQIRWGFFSW